MKVGPYTNCMVQASNIKSNIFSNIMTGQYFITTVRDHILQWHHIDDIYVCGITPLTLVKGDWTICTVNMDNLTVSRLGIFAEENKLLENFYSLHVWSSSFML